MPAINAQTDFNTIIGERGETVTWHENTEVTDAQSGDFVESFDAGTSISAIIVRVPEKDIKNSVGELTNQHFYMFAKSTRAINIKDRIVWNSVNFDVEEVLDRVYDFGTLVYQKFLLRRLVADA